MNLPILNKFELFEAIQKHWGGFFVNMKWL